MCVAIPSGHQEHGHSSALWNFISASPFRLLGTGAVFQAVLLGFFWLAIEKSFINSAELLMTPARISLYISLFAVILFPVIGLLMTYYPQRMGRGETEYLHYAGLFFSANFSLLLFYTGVFFSQGLITGSMIFLLVSLFFAFKPLWWVGFWADKQNQQRARLVNFSLVMVLVSLSGFILFI